MTEKYTLPSAEEILNLVNTEEGRDKIISEFRTKTDNLSIEEALALRAHIDFEVAALVERVKKAENQIEDSFDWESQYNLCTLRDEIATAYGYDSYNNGEWVNSYN